MDNSKGITDDTLFQSYLEDIRQTKNQQWVTASYVLAFQAAIITFTTQAICGAGDCWKNVINIIAIAVSVAAAAIGITLEILLQCDLKHYRKKKDELRENKTRKYKIANILFIIMFILVYITSSVATVIVCHINIGII